MYSVCFFILKCNVINAQPDFRYPVGTDSISGFLCINQGTKWVEIKHRADTSWQFVIDTISFKHIDSFITNISGNEPKVEISFYKKGSYLYRKIKYKGVLIADEQFVDLNRNKKIKVLDLNSLEEDSRYFHLLGSYIEQIDHFMRYYIVINEFSDGNYRRFKLFYIDKNSFIVNRIENISQDLKNAPYSILKLNTD
jgi:hypothetical protein